MLIIVSDDDNKWRVAATKTDYDGCAILLESAGASGQPQTEGD